VKICGDRLLQGFWRERKNRVLENDEKDICGGRCRAKMMIFDAFSEGCVGNLRATGDQERVERKRDFEQRASSLWRRFRIPVKFWWTAARPALKSLWSNCCDPT